MNYHLYQGDCLNEMNRIQKNSIDMILTDLPYGTTRNRWDVLIPFEPLWSQYLRVIKENGAIVLFGSEPFSTFLRMSQIKLYRYDWIWLKTLGSGFLNAHKMPLKSHEIISVFYKKPPTYNAQKTRKENTNIGREKTNSPSKEKGESNWGSYRPHAWIEDGSRFPCSVIKFSNWNGALFGNTSHAVMHTTQKPIDLLKYLILTYTNENENVLDSCMGSGSCGVACVQTNRNFVGIEKDETFYKRACAWIKEEQNKLDLFNEARNDAQA